ncbi:MAG: hypothetical protein KC486_22930 [Myxococcales bacterium]|nr:hypothetical protein [Myxococcales bacterium]
MKRVIAQLLMGRSAWQLVMIAAVAASVGLWMIYGLRASTLRTLSPTLILFFGTAGAALIVSFVRREAEIKDPERPAAGWGRFVAGIVGLAALIAFVTYSFGHYRREVVSSCNYSLLPETLSERRASLAEAEAKLRSPFALLPELYGGGKAAAECDRSRRDLARVDDGKCPLFPLKDMTCTCGQESFPYDRCDEPKCLHGPQVSRERFDCPGDPASDDLGAAFAPVYAD